MGKDRKGTRREGTLGKETGGEMEERRNSRRRRSCRKRSCSSAEEVVAVELEDVGGALRSADVGILLRRRRVRDGDLRGLDRVDDEREVDAEVART